jgi:hypothetical protein
MRLALKGLSSERETDYLLVRRTRASKVTRGMSNGEDQEDGNEVQ